ncbi:MAG: Stk1 family PASTA domain-containing Ser/Thr kinase [Frankiaceae bacterium]
MSAGPPPDGPERPPRPPGQRSDQAQSRPAPDAEHTHLSTPADDETELHRQSEVGPNLADPTQVAPPRHRHLLGGRYEVGDVLGYGGMAEVFRGRDIRLSREVAVKVLRSDLARDPSFQMRFRREAQAAASLNHPAIVAVYDTGEEASGGAAVPYIIMEFVEGRTLRDVLAQEGRLTVQRALEITADVCAALEFSHRSGIVHRDIKPGNVMLTREGVVKVMDFGIARAVAGGSAAITQTAAVIGTAQYLSPEQAKGEAVDARSDVYSTGVLLFELLTGYPPFRGDSPVAIAYQHVREDPQLPSRLDPDIPPDVDAVVMKALSKNPANRYQSAGEFRADLWRAAVGQPVMATPLLPYEGATQALPATQAYPGYPPPVQPPPRGAQRPARRNLVWIILLAVLALAGVGALAVYQLNKGPSVTVPDIVGATFADAQSRLRSAELQLGTVSYQQDATKQVNTVLSQNPAANTSAHKNDKVDVVVNGTSGQVTIPSVVGQAVATATSQLQSLGLVVKTNQVDSGGASGTVTSCSPAPGTRVNKGSTVTLTYVASLVTVPDVVGLSQSAAEGQLASKGFSVNVQQRQATSNPGVVLSQSPAGGTQQQRGSTVTIVVSQVVSPTTPTSPPPTTPTSPPPTTPTSTPPTTPTSPTSSAASTATSTQQGAGP